MFRHRTVTPPKMPASRDNREAISAIRQHKALLPIKMNGELVIGALTFLSTVGPRRFRGHAQSTLTMISVVGLAARAFRKKT
ncbi:MAG: hypothetical protein AAYR33_08640 [Acetobacteraceae bacterium]